VHLTNRPIIIRPFSSSLDELSRHALSTPSLVPIRVEFETAENPPLRIRDCFVWNINERLINPELFARIFCLDLELPQQYAEVVSAQIRAQLDDWADLAALELGMDSAVPWGEFVPKKKKKIKTTGKGKGKEKEKQGKVGEEEEEEEGIEVDGDEFWTGGSHWKEGMEEVPECRVILSAS
jgi:hypothetical protein